MMGREEMEESWANYTVVDIERAVFTALRGQITNNGLTGVDLKQMFIIHQ